ncbi:MAG: HAD-IA family hydrolase, partial [Pseudomonadota bacterium]
ALRGGRAMLTLGFERAGWADMTEVDRQYAHLLAAYDTAIDHHTTLYPGALDAVRALRADGYSVSICTNKPAGLAEKLVRSLGVRDDFDALIGADTLPTRKPDPAPFWAAVDQAGGDRTKCLLVGDTQTDRATSTNAGVPSILVTFGPAGGEMAALEPDALLADYGDLHTTVRDLIG